MEKVWEIKDPDSYLREEKTVKKERQSAPAGEKDPAKAYTLSLLYWGGGQLYADQIGKGAAFLISAVVLLFASVLAVIYRADLLAFLRGREVPLAGAFVAAESFLFLVLLFWPSNAIDAYRHAARSRKTRFGGVNSRVKPLFASLVLPGWGQFMNGQPAKGSIHNTLAVIGAFSFFAAVLTLLAWPLLEPIPARLLVEEVFIVCLFVLPMAPLLWVFSAYDAFRVSGDDLLKEPLGERIKAAYYRGRTQGIVRGVFPRIKSMLLLVLLLAFFVLVIRSWFPTAFYTDLLASAQAALRERGMTIAPELIADIAALLSTAGH